MFVESLIVVNVGNNGVTIGILPLILLIILMFLLLGQVVQQRGHLHVVIIIVNRKASMAKVIEPLRQEQKLISYLTGDTKSVAIVFWHGLGDCIQFIHIYQWLQLTYPNIYFDLLIQNGLGQERIFPNAILRNDLNNLEALDYDYVFLIHFPVEGGSITKAELCCETEIGCPKLWEYGEIPGYPRYLKRPTSNLVGIHYQNTALPSVFNPPVEIAEKIWKEVLDAGDIPIELDFRHPYHNPSNEKFPFIDCTVRQAKATMENLLTLISVCKAVIAVPSGPLHCSLAMRPDRVFYIEKGVPIQRFTYWQIPSVNVNNFQEGKVKEWLLNMHSS